MQASFVHPVIQVLKRALDFFGAGLGLLLCLPVFPLIALAIKLESRARFSSNNCVLAVVGRSMWNCLK